MFTSPRRPPRAQRPRTLPTTARALGLALALSTPLAAPTTASAADPVTPATDAAGTTDPGAVSVLLDEVDPVVLTPGEDITLTGRLLNHGPVPQRLTTLTATVSGPPLSSRTQVAQWVDGDLAPGQGLTLGDDAVGPVVPAGGAVPFEIEVPASITEDLPASAGVLPLLLRAADDDAAGTDAATDAELRATLSSGGLVDVEQPLDVSWVVPLALPADPALTSPVDEQHDPAWAAAIGPESAVTGWLEDLDVPGVTYVVDPATVLAHQPSPGIATPREDAPEEVPEEAPEPTDPLPTPDGATTQAPTPGDTDGSGSTDSPSEDTVPAPVPDGAVATEEPGPTPSPTDPLEADDADVAASVATLATTLAGLPDDQLWWLPEHDPDLTVIHRLGPPTDVVSDLLAPVTEDDGQFVLGTGRHDVAWPVGAAPDADTLTGMAGMVRGSADGADLGVVVLPRESFTADSAALPRRGAAPLRRSDGVLALGADSWTSALVARSQGEAEDHGAGAAAQRVLAHTLATYLEDPTQSRELVIAPPRRTPASAEVLEQVSDGWREAPWLRSVTAQELLDRAEGSQQIALTGVGPQESVLGDLVSVLRPGDSPVDPERAEVLAATDDHLEDLEEVLRDTTALESWRPLLSTLWSTSWRGQEDAWSLVRAEVRDDVETARQGIRVTPSVVNFLTDQGEIDITVVNDLGVAIDEVVLEVVASNGRLQVIRQPGPVSVGADSRASVSFEARSITRGQTTLTAQLSTPSGTTLGEPVPIDVRVQPTGVWVYWVLGGIAGLVLVLGLARALRSSPTPRAPSTPDPTPRQGPADEATDHEGAP